MKYKQTCRWCRGGGDRRNTVQMGPVAGVCVSADFADRKILTIFSLVSLRYASVCVRISLRIRDMDPHIHTFQQISPSPRRTSPAV